ncbi:hypothetical protein [Bosea sp. PAMC 26642]|uniref:hypothetical protein n=1 Tax=Bosea sp. (strain PAMC 26642) TaxID=1792307 RepID=UPI00076FE102|nr:hypothetical protein [Bosea sp. PAMC 26642]AMJ62655.1 hypothetical protein AXW83_22260 [Bosea sp. PAMC 26642]
MEARRLKSIERMLAIQSRIRSLAEWRQKSIEQKAVAARDESRALVASLNGNGVTDGLFVDMTAKRLHRVAITISELETAAVEQTKRVIAETGREKRTARLVDRVRKVKLRADQDNVLIEIMDSAQAKKAASLE